jgi:hypothetical protein
VKTSRSWSRSWSLSWSRVGVNALTAALVAIGVGSWVAFMIDAWRWSRP